MVFPRLRQPGEVHPAPATRTGTHSLNDPNAPEVNSIVPSVTVVALDDGGRILLIHRSELDGMRIHPSMRLRIDHGLAGRSEPYIG